MLAGMDESLDLALNSGELSGISDISPPRAHRNPAMVAMARSMGSFDDCDNTPSGVIDIAALELELAAEEAELLAKQAAEATARQQQVVAQRRLRIELAKSDAGSNRSRSRFATEAGLGSPIPMMDLLSGDPQPIHGLNPIQNNDWRDQFEQDLSMVMEPDFRSAFAQNEALEKAKALFITEERAKNSNLEERFKLEHQERMASYADEHKRTEGIALDRLKAELQTADAAHAEQFQAAVIATEAAIVAREQRIRAEYAEGIQHLDAQVREEAQKAQDEQVECMWAFESQAQDRHREILQHQRQELEMKAQAEHLKIVSVHEVQAQLEMQQWARANEALAADRHHMLQTAECLERERNVASDTTRQALLEIDKLRQEARQRDQQLRHALKQAQDAQVAAQGYALPIPHFPFQQVFPQGTPAANYTTPPAPKQPMPSFSPVAFAKAGTAASSAFTGTPLSFGTPTQHHNIGTPPLLPGTPRTTPRTTVHFPASPAPSPTAHTTGSSKGQGGAASVPSHSHRSPSPRGTSGGAGTAGGSAGASPIGYSSGGDPPGGGGGPSKTPTKTPEKKHKKKKDKKKKHGKHRATGDDPSSSSSSSSDSSSSDSDDESSNPGSDPEETESDKESKRKIRALKKAIRKRRSVEPMVRIKEADQVKITKFPRIDQLRAYKNHVRQEVVAASGRGDDAHGYKPSRRTKLRLKTLGKVVQVMKRWTPNLPVPWLRPVTGQTWLATSLPRLSKRQRKEGTSRVDRFCG